MPGLASILIVDDEPDIRATLAAVLSRESYTVTSAGSAEAAFALIAKNRFDVVITDLMMAGAERGLDVVSAVRSRRPASEVIMLTGFASAASAVKALRDGAFHYLTKPCNLDELKLTVQRALEKQRLETVARTAERAEIARAEAVRARGRMSGLFERAPALIAFCRGPRHRLEFANPAFAELLGQGERIMDLLDQVRNTGKPFVGHEIAIERPNKAGEIETLFFNFALQPTTTENGRRDGIFIHAVDVSEEVRGRHWIAYLAGILAEQALHDSLTGLPNRRLLFDRLEQAIRSAERHHRRHVGLLFLDLDNFKHVNDRLGHAGGDAVLRQVGATIQACLRKSDTVGRLGGDEFAVLLPGLDSAPSAAEVARKLSERLAEPLTVDGQTVEVSASIGIALYPEDGRDVGSLLRKADTAMYRQKRAAHRRRAPRRSA